MLTDLNSGMNGKVEDIQIYPSPVQNFLQIQSSWASEAIDQKVLIYNYEGQLICREKLFFENKKSNIPITLLANGLYFLELKNSSGLYVKKRFVVAR